MFPSVHGVVSQTALNWWEAGGASGAVAVYQPLGAASLAASYTDLSGNGNDAAPGVAPTWAAGTGWMFNGTTQWLDSGVAPAAGWSLFARFSGVANFGIAIGSFSGSATYFNLHPQFSDGRRYYGNGVFAGKLGQTTSGVMGATEGIGYLNGLQDIIFLGWSGTSTRQVTIGAFNNNGVISLFFAGNIQAVAIYNTTLTAPQVLAVSDAMAAL